MVETYHHKYSFNEDILNAIIEMLNKGSRKSHAEFRVQGLLGLRIGVPGVQSLESILGVVHDGFSLNKTGRFLH